MNGFRLGKNALIFSIMTLITVLTWIGVEVYLATTKTTIPEVTQEQMKPLTPQIKKQVIEELKERLWFSEEEMNSVNPPAASRAAILEER